MGKLSVISYRFLATDYDSVEILTKTQDNGDFRLDRKSVILIAKIQK
jgi:hypothetical protein